MIVHQELVCGSALDEEVVRRAAYAGRVQLVLEISDRADRRNRRVLCVVDIGRKCRSLDDFVTEIIDQALNGTLGGGCRAVELIPGGTELQAGLFLGRIQNCAVRVLGHILDKSALRFEESAAFFAGRFEELRCAGRLAGIT